MIPTSSREQGGRRHPGQFIHLGLDQPDFLRFQLGQLSDDFLRAHGDERLAREASSDKREGENADTLKG